MKTGMEVTKASLVILMGVSMLIYRIKLSVQLALYIYNCYLHI